MWKKVSKKQEEKTIEKVMELIDKYDMGLISTIILHTIKPVSYIGAQFGRFFLGPINFLMDDDDINIALTTLENRENLDKILMQIEEREKLKRIKKLNEEKNNKFSKEKGIIYSIKKIISKIIKFRV